jgi:hypothetical protein
VGARPAAARPCELLAWAEGGLEASRSRLDAGGKGASRPLVLRTTPGEAWKKMSRAWLRAASSYTYSRPLDFPPEVSMLSQSSIFPARSCAVQDTVIAREPTAWFAAFEVKVEGKTRYFTFGDRHLAAQGVHALLDSLPAEYRSLLHVAGEKPVSISLSLMNTHSIGQD